MLTHIDLFSGIGGFALAARWAGVETVQFVEIDPFCQKVLKKHWPEVPIHDDVTTFRWDGERPFLLTGGFPCQDVSLAGTGRGLSGERSGLWSEYARIIRDIRPRFVVVENSPGLLVRGMGTVLRDMAEAGYDAEWEVLSAQEIGAPHERERLFIVAYPHTEHGDTRVGSIKNGTGKVFPLRNRECFPFWLQTTDSFVGMDDGVSGRSYRDRGCALGNAIVPQVAYQIIKAIVEVEKSNVLGT